MTINCSTLPPAGCGPLTSDPRVLDSFARRYNSALADASIVATHTNNGDEARYNDKSATYTKCVKQSSPGKVELAAYAGFRAAINAGTFSGFEAVTLGGTRTLNDPMGSYAYSYNSADGSQFGDSIVKPPPQLHSKEYATELIELYWCSLLRDVSFSGYHANQIAQDAAAELSAAVGYAGPTEGGKVTPALLFRGTFDGERIGPYLSQFLLLPTNFGSLPIDQRYTTYAESVDYMTDLITWADVQNGIPTGVTDQKDPVLRYLHDGRSLAAWTHVDELYQAYFTAYLVLSSMKVPVNPGNSYFMSKTQNGFGTFAGPDIAAVLAQVAKIALNAVWYQKWVIHLRHRPESGGGLVHLINTGTHFDGKPDQSVFDSNAVAESFKRYGTYFLSQSFPEGSPSHPAYPTGHGTVGGACITILKFFFDGTWAIPNPMAPIAKGTEMAPWNYNPSMGEPGVLTVNGELHKLAHNITFGHGLHGGIHWRSDSDASIRLGEAVAISFLEDLACTYAEKFSITFTKLDGTAYTISN